MTDADRRAHLLELWLKLPEEERTNETGPMNFYQWVRGRNRSCGMPNPSSSLTGR
jgi:hypothetical protein